MLINGIVVKSEPSTRSRRDARRKVARYTLAYFDLDLPDGHGNPCEYRVAIELPRGWQCAMQHGEAYISLGTQPTLYVPDACPNTLRLLSDVYAVRDAEVASRKAMRSYKGR